MNILFLTSIALATSVADVCNVTAPELPEGAKLETVTLEGGQAWRIRYGKTAVISNEVWRYSFAKDYKCWPVSHAQGEYIPKTLSTINTMKVRSYYKPGELSNYTKRYHVCSESPLTIEGDGWVAILGEAGNLDYARIRYGSGSEIGSVETILEGSAEVTPGYATPWRYVHVAKSAAELADTHQAFMDALNEPSRLKDESWIKPGKVLRVSKLITESALESVDFAKRNGFTYIELDSGWYGNEYAGDPLKPGLAPEKIAKGEHLDVEKVIQYANSNGIGVILYVNREPLKRNRKAIYEQLVKWGVKGIKLGFVNVGSQSWRKWVLESIEEAAKYKLVVDIHDEYRLSGIQKTYPHVLTVEGIHGNEEMPCARHNVALVYTRFMDGPGDYTPCWKVGRIKNTLAHQLAMPAVYTSGLQFLFWYQRPDQIDEKNPALDFWREIPVEFDEVRHLDGKVGEFAVVARRKGCKWFLGALNANEKRTFAVPLDFVGKEKLNVRLFRDENPDNTKSCAPVVVDSFMLNKGEPLKVTAAANGGFSAIIE